MTSIVGGLAGTPAFIGFGFAVPGVTVLGVNIDIVGLDSVAFSMPRDGVITSISAYFSVTVGIGLPGSTVTVHAQLYSSPTPNDTFTAVAGTDVAMTPFVSPILVGATTNGTLTGLNIPVTNQTRLLMVFFITSTGLNLVNTLVGLAGAGVNIQ